MYSGQIGDETPIPKAVKGQFFQTRLVWQKCATLNSVCKIFLDRFQFHDITWSYGRPNRTIWFQDGTDMVCVEFKQCVTLSLCLWQLVMWFGLSLRECFLKFLYCDNNGLALKWYRVCTIFRRYAKRGQALVIVWFSWLLYNQCKATMISYASRAQSLTYTFGHLQPLE